MKMSRKPLSVFLAVMLMLTTLLGLTPTTYASEAEIQNLKFTYKVNGSSVSSLGTVEKGSLIDIAFTTNYIQFSGVTLMGDIHNYYELDNDGTVSIDWTSSTRTYTGSPTDRTIKYPKFSGSFSVDTSKLSAGSHTIKVYYYYGIRSEREMQTITFTVKDSTVPSTFKVNGNNVNSGDLLAVPEDKKFSIEWTWPKASFEISTSDSKYLIPEVRYEVYKDGASKYSFYKEITLTDKTNFSGQRLGSYRNYYSDVYTNINHKYTYEVDTSKLTAGTYTLYINLFHGDGCNTSSHYQKLYNFRFTVSAVHKVTFDLNGGEINESGEDIIQNIPDGETATNPGTPEKEGQHFDHWEDENGNPFVPGETPVKKDMEIKAIYNVQVTFMTKTAKTADYTQYDKVQTIIAGKKATRPTAPSAGSGLPADTAFTNWYTTDALNTVFDFNTAIVKDTIIYGGYADTAYDITFRSDKTIRKLNYQNATADNTYSKYVQKIATTGAVAEPTSWSIVDKSYKLTGWKDNNDDDYTFGNAPTEGLVLTAQYAKIVVTFDPNGGTLANSYSTSQNVGATDGKLVNACADPTPPAGKKFLGWLVGSATVPVSSETVNGIAFTEDATVTASYGDITVTYKLNGGKVNGSTNDITGYLDNTGHVVKLTDIPVVNEVAKKFDVWYADEGLTTPFDFENTVPTTDVILYAKYINKDVYTVHYHANINVGGAVKGFFYNVASNIGAMSDSYSGNTSHYKTLTVTFYEGQNLTQLTSTAEPSYDDELSKVFDKWYTTDTRSTAFTFGNEVSTYDTDQNKIIDIYAGYTTNTYNVKLVADVNVNSEATYKVSGAEKFMYEFTAVPHGTQVTDLYTDLANDGYEFLGWYKQSGVSPVEKITSEDTLYGHWTPYVTFDAKDDGKVGGNKTTKIAYESTAKAPSVTDVTTGKKFIKWKLVGSDPARYIEAGDDIPATTVPVTYEAVYEDWTYTVIFHANNGNDNDKKTKENVPYNTTVSTISLPNNWPTYANHSFTETWKDSQGATVTTVQGTEDGQTIHLYADWTENGFVTFKSGSHGSFAESATEKKVYLVSGKPESVPAVTDTNSSQWKFNDTWKGNDDPAFNGEITTNTTLTAGKIYTAQYNPVVTFVVTNDGSITGNGEVEVKTGAKAPKVTPNTGKDFLGWYKQSDTTKTVVLDDEASIADITEPTIYVAKYKNSDTVKVIYHADVTTFASTYTAPASSAFNTGKSVLTFTVYKGTNANTLTAVSTDELVNEEYHFNGWTKTQNSDVAFDLANAGALNEDIDLYPIITEVKVTFDADDTDKGWFGDPKEQTKEVWVPFKSTTSVPNEFAMDTELVEDCEWKLNEEVFDFNTLITAPITLKADYTEKEEEPCCDKVRLHGNGGWFDCCKCMLIKKLEVGKNPEEIYPTPTRKGYKFIGWFLEPTGGEKVTELAEGTKDLYAQWEKIEEEYDPEEHQPEGWQGFHEDEPAAEPVVEPVVEVPEVSPQTDDSMNIALYLALALMAMVGAALTAKSLRKQN